MLKNKRVLLGISGSIAAYKTPELVRQLVKKGALVKVVMTPASADFVAPLSLSVVSGNPVYSEISSGNTWNNHVELANWADLMLIAPASALTVSKMAEAHCDNLLTLVYLSSHCPVFFAPAMDLDMYQSAPVKRNIKRLQDDGKILIPPGTGALASGLSGEGRMEEPEHIIRFLEKHLSASLPLHKKKILVSAGPTQENLDPVRYLGNRSSGKMGFALAEELADRGAEVILVSGPVSLDTINKSIRLIRVNTAEEMFRACVTDFKTCDAAIMAAAVADFKPSKVAAGKIKKTGKGLHIDLVPTQDILAELGKKKKKSQILVGFALETEDGIANAKDKLKRKNLDFIVLNSLKDKGAGFGTDTNKITILDKSNKINTFGLKQKSEAAKDIVDHLSELWK